MKITPSPLTISQLFSSMKEQFYIPAYQRRYAWGEKQLGELFDDINYLKQEDTHLLSTVLFLTDLYNADINQLEIVDGQQRLTSISILLMAIRDKFLQNGDNDSAKEIDKYLTCRGLDKKEKNKILLGDLDNPDYLKLRDMKDIDEIKNKKLINAYELFYKWLSEKIEDLDSFYYKVINNISIIRLDIGNARDAYKLFETINNRGLRLSPTDIIKNFLLGHASIINDNSLNKIRDYWKSVIINLDTINTDDFFRQFLAGTLRRKIPFSKLIDEFKRYYLNNIIEAKDLSEYNLYLDDQNDLMNELDEYRYREIKSEVMIDTISIENKKKISMFDFVKSLKEASLIYSKIINNTFSNEKINSHLYNLSRIRSIPSYTFLLNLFQRNISDKEKISILKLIESFMLRRHICEYRTAELDDIFPKLINIKNKNLFENIRLNLIKFNPPDDEFRMKFSTYNFKGNFDRAKYILEILEYDKINDKGEYILTTGSDLHLEHIIPQAIHTKKSKKEYGDWVEYLGSNALENHGQYVNLIGNFTLIAGVLNIKASNNPFLSKKKAYKHSNIHLTKQLVENYRTFKFSHVKMRSEEFANKAVKLWKI